MMLTGLLVLQGVVSLVQGEVVSSFKTSCPAVFIKDQNNVTITPSVPAGKDQYKQICQKYSNCYRYATLYDTTNRIPVYSAYVYNGYKQTTRKSWMIEPQLDGYSETEMTTEAGKEVGANQAVNKDYISNYQRGHLYPCCQNCVQDQCESTFTLTNAAPQAGPDNKQWYWKVERGTVQDIEGTCDKGTAYVVTGVIPGNKKLNNRVNIPSYYWSAFCCGGKRGRNGMLASQAYMMEMRGDGKAEAERLTVAQLNCHLSEAVFTFKAFGTLEGCS